MKTDFSDYKLELTMNVDLVGQGEPEEYINPVSGRILYYSEKKDNYEICGKLECLFVNFDRMVDDEENTLMMLDDHSGELFEITQLYNSEYSEETGQLTAETFKALGYSQDDALFNRENIIYVQSLEIIRKHRGVGIGSHFLKNALTYLAGVLHFSFYVLNPAPFRADFAIPGQPLSAWDKKMAFDKFDRNLRQAEVKMRGLFGKIGFVPVADTDFMVCPSVKFILEQYEPVEEPEIAPVRPASVSTSVERILPFISLINFKPGRTDH